jgi:hypothetical protein
MYDDEYVDYVVAILQKCRDHRLLVFIDPHQDVVRPPWGGTSAPNTKETIYNGYIRF